MTRSSHDSSSSAPRHGHGTSGAHALADRMGIGVSITCAIHCALAGALSVAPSVLSLGDAGSLGAVLELLELPLLAMALLIGLWALVPAFRREHGNPQPLVLYALGIAQLAASRLVEGVPELALTIVGVAFVSTAHIANLRACARAHACASGPAVLRDAPAPRGREAVAAIDARP